MNETDQSETDVIVNVSEMFRKARVKFDEDIPGIWTDRDVFEDVLEDIVNRLEQMHTSEL
jgi:hypothetical protein